jgi:methylamine---corrinoid protein Co-methyltransferase
MNTHERMLDLIDRSYQGPIVEEEVYDRKHIAAGINRVVQAYDIKADHATMVNQDDNLADRVWQAALDFLAASGIYHQSTKRVIYYSRDEIEVLLEAAPDRIEYGEGPDKRLEVARNLDDPRVPMNCGASIGSPIPEKLFLPVMQSYLQESLVDITGAPTIETVFNRELRTGTPLEILACWREVELMHEALERAGRPGLAWSGVGMSTSEIGQLSCVNPAGHNHSNPCTFGIISELKGNNGIFNKMFHAYKMDVPLDPYANPIYGGLGGGVEGQAVLITAAMIALSVWFNAVMVGSSPTHPFLFNDTSKELLLPSSLSFQALARNSHLLINLTNTPVGGPGTKTLLYETVAFTTMATVSGISRILGPRSATGSISCKFSGLEARFAGELLRAAAKLDRGKAEEITQRAYEKYADDLDKKPYGKDFQEVYDLKTVQPTDEWQQMYEQVKEEAAGWGLDFS